MGLKDTVLFNRRDSTISDMYMVDLNHERYNARVRTYCNVATCIEDWIATPGCYDERHVLFHASS